MNTRIYAARIYASIIAGIVCFPALSHAQSSNVPLTRDQVRAQLVAVEKAGYRPAGDDPTYPANLQSAEARVAAQSADAAKTSYGAVSTIGSSQ
jgi:hypothetical protein